VAATATRQQLSGNELLDYILGRTKAAGGDPRAVASVAYAESAGFTKFVGDEGTSFGPFQLHVGGGLPASVRDDPSTPQDERALWANSPVGVSYGVGRAVGASRGKSGSDAIAAIVSGFERPADYGRGVAAGLSPDAAARQTRDYSVATSVYDNLSASPAAASSGTAPITSLLQAIRSVFVPDATRVGAVHPTSGLPNYQARDVFATHGSAVFAPEAGTIVKVGGNDPSAGAASAHGAFGYSEYLHGESGSDYYFTHLGQTFVQQGAHVAAKQEIATVGDFPDATGTPDHVHVGVKGVPDPAVTLVRDANAYRGAHPGGDPSLPGGADIPFPGLPIPGAIKSIGDLIGWLTNVDNLKRIGEVILGGILLILGLLMVGRASLASAGNPQRQLAGAVRAVR
jgi:murein DD-endopeptidase MepM/ murein hydrolase activator NlpD